MAEYTCPDCGEEIRTDIYNMDLHEQIELDPYRLVTRVPGGWIYTEYSEDTSFFTSVFVPYNDAFHPNL